MKIITDEACAGYARPGHPEKPFRILRTLEKLRAQTDLPITFAGPGPAEEAAILRAHSPAMLVRLDQPEDFDADTPAHDGIAGYARASVGVALEAMRCARAGETVFCLMRPPGHHATRERAMGFCYLNNIAIAALAAQAAGARRVAVFDFDVHHGARPMRRHGEVETIVAHVFRAGAGIARVLMHGKKRRAFVIQQNVLGAVAVVHVKIKHRHPPRARRLRRQHGGGEVVQIPKPHRTLPRRVVPGRTHEAENGFAGAGATHRLQRRARRGAGVIRDAGMRGRVGIEIFLRIFQLRNHRR